MKQSNVSLKNSFHLNWKNNYKTEYIIHSENCLFKGEKCKRSLSCQLSPFAPLMSHPWMDLYGSPPSGFTGGIVVMLIGMIRGRPCILNSGRGTAAHLCKQLSFHFCHSDAVQALGKITVLRKDFSTCISRCKEGAMEARATIKWLKSFLRKSANCGIWNSILWWKIKRYGEVYSSLFTWVIGQANLFFPSANQIERVIAKKQICDLGRNINQLAKRVKYDDY